MAIPRHVPVPATILTCLLSACATPPPPDTAQARIDMEILEASQRIGAAQSELYQAAALNQQTLKLPVALDGDQDAVTIAWHGDALQLLTSLARKRGLPFSFIGLKLPLPVNVDVKNMPFKDVLQLLRAQIGYRAEITQFPDKLVLQYAKPKS